MDAVIKKGSPMVCHKCTTKDIERNHYRKAMGVCSPDHTEFPIHLPIVKHRS